MRWKHGKLLSNLRNGLDAACGGGPEARELADRLQARGSRRPGRRRDPFSTPEEERARRGDAVEVRPSSSGSRGGSSTWQSLARGTGSIEVDYLNGEIGLLGRLHGDPDAGQRRRPAGRPRAATRGRPPARSPRPS